MKILIADDERLVRAGLKSMLEEIGVPARGIACAADGAEMIEAAARELPDVAFVDIRMPRLDGLSGIERGRALSPTTRWVILTSHSSFEYARRAIELGAVEYLLKPVSPEELRRVLSAAEAARKKEILRVNLEFENRVSSLVHEPLSPPRDAMEYFAGMRFQTTVVLFDEAADRRALRERHRAAGAEIRARAVGTVDGNLRLAVCTLASATLTVVAAWHADGQAYETLEGFLRTLHIALESQAGSEARVTMIRGDECSSFSALQDELAGAASVSALRCVLGVGRIIAAEEAREAARGSLARLCEGLARAAEAWRAHNRLEFLAGVGQAREALGHVSSAPLAAVERFVRFSMWPRVPSPLEGDWLGGLEAQAERMPPADVGVPGFVEQAVSFVGSHYAEDVSIGRIARHLGVTPNYLSSLFHKTYGMTYVKFLTRLRIEKARELLSGGMRVQDVARSVGYANVRHFSALFRAYVGRHPSRVRPQVEKSEPET